MKIGLLAVQGAIAPHAEKLKELGAESVEVRRPKDLEGCDGIILPGGESTAMILLLHLNHLWEPLKDFVAKKPAWGVCAGTILLAKEVSHPVQESLGALSAQVERNSYGRQLDSFIGNLEMTAPGRERFGQNEVEGVFIRAPRFRRLDSGVVTLLERDGEPVMVEEGNVVASTFHPELSPSSTLHRYFLNKCR